MSERPYRTTSEAARLLGVHPNTLKRIAPSALPYHTVSQRGDRRYRIEDVRAFIAARTVR
jgi:DNA-binding transcriptional MerR regulator